MHKILDSIAIIIVFVIIVMTKYKYYHEVSWIAIMIICIDQV